MVSYKIQLPSMVSRISMSDAQSTNNDKWVCEVGEVHTFSLFPTENYLIHKSWNMFAAFRIIILHPALVRFTGCGLVVNLSAVI